MNTHARDQFIKMNEDVLAFHAKFGLMPCANFASMPQELVAFREKFIMEECQELYDALARKDRVEMLDAFVDISYIALGTLYLSGAEIHWYMHPKRIVSTLEIVGMASWFALSETSGQHMVDLVYACRESAYVLGLDFDEAWRRVHATNMLKIRVERAADSKRGSTFDVKKPEGWVKPVLTDLVDLI